MVKPWFTIFLFLGALSSASPSVAGEAAPGAGPNEREHRVHDFSCLGPLTEDEWPPAPVVARARDLINGWIGREENASMSETGSRFDVFGPRRLHERIEALRAALVNLARFRHEVRVTFVRPSPEQLAALASSAAVAGLAPRAEAEAFIRAAKEARSVNCTAWDSLASVGESRAIRSYLAGYQVEVAQGAWAFQPVVRDHVTGRLVRVAVSRLQSRGANVVRLWAEECEPATGWRRVRAEAGPLTLPRERRVTAGGEFVLPDDRAALLGAVAPPSPGEDAPPPTVLVVTVDSSAPPAPPVLEPGSQSVLFRVSSLLDDRCAFTARAMTPEVVERSDWFLAIRAAAPWESPRTETTADLVRSISPDAQAPLSEVGGRILRATHFAFTPAGIQAWTAAREREKGKQFAINAWLAHGAPAGVAPDFTTILDAERLRAAVAPAETGGPAGDARRTIAAGGALVLVDGGGVIGFQRREHYLMDHHVEVAMGAVASAPVIGEIGAGVNLALAVRRCDESKVTLDLGVQVASVAFAEPAFVLEQIDRPVQEIIDARHTVDVPLGGGVAIPLGEWSVDGREAPLTLILSAARADG
ncbi:MAG: hypothetical protein HY719_04210 [Planctomycetes bacterium]|nr:hypothetical protein [Planctomycetota bacterium]